MNFPSIFFVRITPSEHFNPLTSTSIYPPRPWRPNSHIILLPLNKLTPHSYPFSTPFAAQFLLQFTHSEYITHSFLHNFHFFLNPIFSTFISLNKLPSHSNTLLPPPPGRPILNYFSPLNKLPPHSYQDVNYSKLLQMQPIKSTFTRNFGHG